LVDLCDFFVHIEVPLAVAFDRAKLRDVPVQGMSVLEKYVSKYFPAQLRYLRACQPARKADLVIDNRDYDAPRIHQNATGLPTSAHGGVGRPSGGFGKFIKDRNRQHDERPFDAICFDLWDTLVLLPDEVKEQAFQTTAGLLGVDPEWLRPIWTRARQKRETVDLRTFLEDFCRELEIRETCIVLDEVMRNRRRIHGSAMSSPRSDAELTLRMLRAAGYRVALVSNCTSDVPGMLKKTPIGSLFDVEIYSFREGVLKPDRAIFLRASERLGVPPKRCLYVGDGNHNELHGATSVGMISMLLETSKRREWHGYRIKELSDLLDPLIP
jgi:putative hydrolase of the HAD superfamily